MNLSNYKTWVWLQANDLNAKHPALQQITNYDAILFIWDEAHFAQQFFSKQRLFFIWQCLQDFKGLPLIVIKGETDLILKRLYKDNSQTIIFSPENAHINFSRWPYVRSIAPKQFIKFDKALPFSFFNYWKTAEKQLFSN